MTSVFVKVVVSGAILPPAGRFSEKKRFFCKSPGLRCYLASGGSLFWKITFLFVKVLVSGAILPPAGRFSGK